MHLKTVESSLGHGHLTRGQTPALGIQMGDSQKLGVPFGGPQNKDSSIFGSILGLPYLGKLPKSPM